MGKKMRKNVYTEKDKQIARETERDRKRENEWMGRKLGLVNGGHCCDCLGYDDGWRGCQGTGLL